MSQFIQNRVSEAIWPWCAKPEQGRHTRMGMKRRAIIQSVIMVGIALLLMRAAHHRIGGFIVLTMALLVLISGLFIPALFKSMEQFGKLLGKGVSVVLTWALLAPFYYLCFFSGPRFSVSYEEGSASEEVFLEKRKLLGAPSTG